MMNVFGMTTSSQETLQLSFLFPPQPLEKDTLPVMYDRYLSKKYLIELNNLQKWKLDCVEGRTESDILSRIIVSLYSVRRQRH